MVNVLMYCNLHLILETYVGLRKYHFCIADNFGTLGKQIVTILKPNECNRFFCQPVHTNCQSKNKPIFLFT